MTILAIAALLASLVNKGLLSPKLAAAIGAAASVIIDLLFLARPIPVLLSAPVFLALLWASLAFLKRATLLLLPLAIIGVLGSVFAAAALRSWLDAELLMRDPATQAKLNELNELNRQAGRVRHSNRDAGDRE